MMIGLFLSFGLALPSSKPKNGVLIDAKVYGNYQCSVRLQEGNRYVDAEIHEIRSLDLRLYSWRIKGRGEPVVILGRCGFGEECKFTTEKKSSSIVIEMGGGDSCAIRPTNANDVFD